MAGETILYFKTDGTLFGYFEAEKSFDESLKGMSGEEINENGKIHETLF